MTTAERPDIQPQNPYTSQMLIARMACISVRQPKDYIHTGQRLMDMDKEPFTDRDFTTILSEAAYAMQLDPVATEEAKSRLLPELAERYADSCKDAETVLGVLGTALFMLDPDEERKCAWIAYQQGKK